MRTLGILKMGAMQFEVKAATPREKKALRNTYGLTDCDKCVIWLREGMPNSLHQETFAHEMMHAIMFASGAGYFLETQVGEVKVEAVEEMLVRMMAPYLLNVKYEPTAC